MKTYFLHEIAALWRLDEQMDLPVLWLKRRIASGKFRARRIGRQWVMTDADVEYNLDQLANLTTKPAPTAPADQSAGGVDQTVMTVPSLASMRRRRSA